VSAARLYRQLRGRGVTIGKTIDMLIGAFCIASGFPLLHDDRDFDPMETFLGLRVVR
jgi:predicted nucleic acid-binding protein